MKLRIAAVVLALVLLPVHTADAAPAALTVALTDRAGGPAARAEVWLANPVTNDHLRADSVNGIATIAAPPGDYVLWSKVYTGRSEVSLLMWPHFSVTGPATIALDARDARPVEVTVPHRDARLASAVILADLTWTIGGEQYGTPVAVTTADAPVVSSAQLGPDTPFEGLLTRVKANMTAPGAYYALVWEERGHMVDGLRRTVRSTDLTEVRADYALLGDPTRAATGSTVTDSGVDMTSSVLITLPQRRTEYYTKGRAWQSTLCYEETCLSGRPGGRWNYGPFLPNARFIERLGDRLRIIGGVADQAGHHGLDGPGVTEGRYTLYRDGVEVAETPMDQPGFPGLPPENAKYRIELDGSFSALLPGTFHAAWTFESAYEEVGEGMLPTLNVRFTPRLEPDNHARAGRPLTLPIAVDGGGDLTSVEVSFDAGTTWQTAPVGRTGDGWTTQVTPPPGTADISLRARAADDAGNAVEQTMTRAIPLR